MKKNTLSTILLASIIFLLLSSITLGMREGRSLAEEISETPTPEVSDGIEPTEEPTPTPSPTPITPVTGIDVKYTIKSIYPENVVSKKTSLDAGDHFELWLNDKITLTTTVTPDDASDKTLTYTSSNTDTATVSAKGVVTVKNMGDTTITVGSLTNPEVNISFSIHCYKTSIDVVKDLGAVPDDGVSDLTALKKALTQGQYMLAGDTLSVSIPDGTYDIDGTITATSNTVLTLSENTIIKRAATAGTKAMLKSKVISTIYGYNQFVNFSMSGGVWDGNADGSGSSDLIYFGHGKNITIKNTTIKNNCGHHLIEFAGIDTATIDNVSLSGYMLPSTDDGYTSQKEAIQLDYCSAASASSMKPNDYSVSKNITIKNCSISNYMCGIGAHGAVSNVYLTDITIKNNTFTNITNICIDARNFKNLTVAGNKVTGFHEFFYSEGSSGTIKNNTVKQASYKKLTSKLLNTANGIEMIKSDFTVSGNTLSGQTANGIYIGTDATATIKNNSIKKSGKYGIYTYKATVKFATNTFSSNGKGVYHTDKDAVIKSSDDIRAYYVALKSTYKYTGKKITPVTKISGLNKKYYTITYKNNKKKGTATVVIKGKGKVLKTNKLTFEIV